MCHLSLFIQSNLVTKNYVPSIVLHKERKEQWLKPKTMEEGPSRARQEPAYHPSPPLPSCKSFNMTDFHNCVGRDFDVRRNPSEQGIQPPLRLSSTQDSVSRRFSATHVELKNSSLSPKCRADTSADGSNVSLLSFPDLLDPALDAAFHSNGLISFGVSARDFRLSRQTSMGTLREGSELARMQKGSMIADGVSVAMLLKAIADECAWTEVEVMEDLGVLHRARLRNVKGLRLLSSAGWNSLQGISPVTKDILRSVISANSIHALE
ncbi:hypothetical protein BC830DRAFT_1111725 [Chytriomyces sp. MP71]|nr:hypothetical protein BC830DRAFT_1111725 [Chytriomyces sp. MP71]